MKNWTPPEGYIEKKYNYTYKLTFKLDERFYYYGVHASNVNPYEDDYYGSGTKIKEYKKKYGKDCFNKEILEFFPTKKDALLAEDKLVPIELLSDPFCLNRIQGGGTFDSSGMKMSDEERKKVSERFKGKPRTKESIEKMIDTRRRRGTDKHSEETKKHLSEINKGRIPISKDNITTSIKIEELEKYITNGWTRGYTNERNEKIRLGKLGEKNPMYKKTPSKETIEKMLETKRKRGKIKHSEETKAKLTKINRMHAQDPEFCKHLSECCKGINTWSKGRKCMTKDGIETFVDVSDIDNYIKDGWTLGRISKRKFMHKGDCVKNVLLDEIDKYIKEGWEFGRGKRKV